MKLLRQLLPLLKRPNRIRRGACCYVARTARRPYTQLVRHFLCKLVRGDNTSSAEFELGLGPLLGLLAAPGAFQSFLLLNKYSTFVAWLKGRLQEDLLVTSMPDKVLFLCLAMGITGIVTALKWDRILPDSQDFANLAPLPLRPRTILAANVSAIGIAVAILAVTVNGVSMLLFPAFVSAASPTRAIEFLPFFVAHATSLLLASLFSFTTVFALLGTMAAMLPAGVFRSWQVRFRALLVVAFGLILFSGFASPSLYQGLGWYPPVWFLSLYQAMQHRASPAMQETAQLSIAVVAGLCLLTVCGYLASYRRRFASVLETSRNTQTRRFSRWLLRVPLELSFARPGLEKAGVQFGIYALLRNDAQRVCLLVSAAFGWLFAAQAATLADVSAPVPALMPAYLVLIGTRFALEIPAGVPANWIFRVAGGTGSDVGAGVARRMLWLAVGVLVGSPCLVVSSWSHGPVVAALHTMYVMACAIPVGVVLLAHYRKIPFTCHLPAFRENIPVWLVLHVVGFAIFTRGGASIERWFLAEPLRFLLIPLILLLFFRGWATWTEGDSQVLTFENETEVALESLNLSEAG